MSLVRGVCSHLPLVSSSRLPRLVLSTQSSTNWWQRLAPPLSSTLHMNNRLRRIYDQSNNGISPYSYIRTMVSDASSPPTSSPIATAASESATKPRCDPYGQGGQPLSTEDVEEGMKLHLKDGWKYDITQRMLHKQYKFLTSK
jgi:hypothetical protein